MGPSRPRNSTRAQKAHPPQKIRRKPAFPKPSKLSTGNDVPTEVLHEVRDGVPTRALQRIQGKLGLIRSTVAITARALHDQNCELDADAATVLGHHVIDALTDQMAEIGLLLGEDMDGGAS